MSARLPGLVLAGVLSLTAVGAFAQAEAERRLDAAIERLRAALGPDSRLEIGGRSVDPVSGRATLTNVVITKPDRSMTVPELRIQEVEETRIGRAELLRTTFRGEGTTGEVARLVVTGLPIPAPGASLDIATLSVGGLEVEAARMQDPARGVMSLGRLEARDWTPQGLAAGTLEEFEYRDAAKEPRTMRLGRVVMEAVTLPLNNADFDPTAFRAGRVTMERTEIRDPAANVVVGLGRLALRDWMPGRPASLGVEGVQIETPTGTTGQLAFTMARLEAAGVDGPGAVAALLGGMQVPDPFPGVPQRGLLEGVEASLDGQQVLSLRRIESEGRLAEGIASGSLVTDGLRIIPPRGQADWLEGLGYRELSGGLELRGQAPRDGGRLTVEPLRITWEQAGTLTVAAQVDGMPAMPAAGATMEPEATAMAMAEARLAGLTLTLRDQGLLGRVLAQQARQQRMPEARLREQWAQMALAMPLPGDQPQPRGPRGAPPAATSGPPAKGKGGAAAPAAPAPAAGPDPMIAFREAVARFIRQPGTLEITLRPPAPLTFTEMGGLGAEGPSQAARRLGLSATAR